MATKVAAATLSGPASPEVKAGLERNGVMSPARLSLCVLPLGAMTSTSIWPPFRRPLPPVFAAPRRVVHITCPVLHAVTVP